MDSIVFVIVSVGIGIVAGIGNAVDKYKAKKSKNKLKKRLDILEAEKKAREEAEAPPIETPSENGYSKPEHNAPYIE